MEDIEMSRMRLLLHGWSHSSRSDAAILWQLTICHLWDVWIQDQQLEVQVMETRKTKLGADHPSTLITMNNLAFTWKAKGWDTEARRLMSDCVQRRSCILGV